MVRRALLPLSLALAAATAASLTPAGRAGAADMAGVVVRDSNFSPNRLTIHAGDTVIFAKAQDSQLAHSVTSDTGAFDEELSDKRYIGLRFQQPGTYAYHCRYHGAAGGSGMAGLVLVEDAAPTSTTATTAPGATTTTTAPGATTTTTKPPTTTTTKPPKPTTTTTKPPTTTTTRPATTTMPPPPPPPPPQAAPAPPPPGPPAGGAMSPPPPAPSPGRPASPATAPKGGAAPSGGKDRAAAAIAANGKGPAAPPPTSDTTAPAAVPPVPDPAAADAAAAAAAAAAAPPPDTPAPTATEPPPVVPIDQSILDTLAANRGDQPPDNGSKLLLVAGVAFGVFVLSVAAWAFYHRSSRYMPA